MIEENKNIYISHWLLLITFLVALLIIIGGLTRLTDSGLSITRWDVISGIFPPMSVKDWEEYVEMEEQYDIEESRKKVLNKQKTHTTHNEE